MNIERFEDESEYSKKYIKHDNRYGYSCHHYMDNYIDDDFMNDEQFNMECNNCEKIFEVYWNAETKVLHTF